MIIFSTVLSHEISISSGRTQTSVCWPTSESLWCLLVKNNLLGSEKMVVKLFDRTLYGRTRLWLAGFKWCLLKLLKTNSFQNALIKKKRGCSVTLILSSVRLLQWLSEMMTFPNPSSSYPQSSNSMSFSRLLLTLALLSLPLPPRPLPLSPSIFCSIYFHCLFYSLEECIGLSVLQSFSKQKSFIVSLGLI